MKAVFRPKIFVLLCPRYNIDRSVFCGMNGRIPFPSYNMDIVGGINLMCAKLGLAVPFPDWEHPGGVLTTELRNIE